MILNTELTILYDGDSSVYIFAPPTAQQTVTGLCGNFDGNPNNDFMDKFGSVYNDQIYFINR